jgi:uncharacterized Ntn-hydrolase superfamily protein
MVDKNGGAAAHSGAECFDWKGHVLGEGFTCQGNILLGAPVVHDMADEFKAAKGELADRLVAALAAGDAAGGDKRGRQGAAVLVVKASAGYGGDNDRFLDLRVDDDPYPIPKLQKLVMAHHLFFGKPDPADQTPITPDIAREIQGWLRGNGYSRAEAHGQWDEATKQAFWALVGNENLEERWSLSGDTNSIDRVALEYLRGRFGI